MPSGFKACEACARRMSASDPYLICMWCLGVHHDSHQCDACQQMKPKSLRECHMKLLAARLSSPGFSRRRSPSEDRARSRGRSRERHPKTGKRKHKRQTRRPSSHTCTAGTHTSRLVPGRGAQQSLPPYPPFPGVGAMRAEMEAYSKAPHSFRCPLSLERLRPPKRWKAFMSNHHQRILPLLRLCALTPVPEPIGRSRVTTQWVLPVVPPARPVSLRIALSGFLR